MKFLFAVALIFIVIQTCLAKRGGSSSADDDDLTLVKLLAINRHGHRAPNAPYWRMCPNDAANRRAYGVRPEDLTGVGYSEEHSFGLYLRDTYGEFIGKKFNDRRHFICAVGEPRTLQSAQVISEALFPDGFGPRGFLPSRPQVIPVFSDIAAHEYVLNDAPCWPRTRVDVSNWLRTVGENMAKDPKNAALISKLESMCGMPPHVAATRSIDLIIKIVVDGVIFGHDFGLEPLGGKIDKDMFFQLRNLSNTFLLGKLYGTDAQKTYVAGNLPELIVETGKFVESNGTHQLPTNFAQDNEMDAIEHAFNLFDVHREMMYGLAFFWDWEYSVPNMAPGELPASSTVIIEYLRSKKTGGVVVKVVLWTPHNGHWNLKLRECEKELCTVAELDAIYQTRRRRTGTRPQLCGARGL
jgi:hypothetical protein